MCRQGHMSDVRPQVCGLDSHVSGRVVIATGMVIVQRLARRYTGRARFEGALLTKGREDPASSLRMITGRAKSVMLSTQARGLSGAPLM